MHFPVVLVPLIVSALFCLEVGPRFAHSQELPPLPKNATNKTVILKQSLQRSAKYCSSQHETTTARVITLIMTDVDDQEAKCFLHCMLQRYRMMDDDGNFHQEKLEAFLDYIPDSAFLRSIRRNVPTCKTERGTSPCDSAYRFMRCFYLKARAQVKIEDVNQLDMDAMQDLDDRV